MMKKNTLASVIRIGKLHTVIPPGKPMSGAELPKYRKFVKEDAAILFANLIYPKPNEPKQEQ